jgi:hypothetical protein
VKINFNNKKFVLLENSKTGKVNSETLFKFKQSDDVVTADYFGGTIKYGKIIAHFTEKKLTLLYQCITQENELKAGKAIAEISLTEKDKIKLKLDWQWLTHDQSTGKSEYLEI